MDFVFHNLQFSECCVDDCLFFCTVHCMPFLDWWILITLSISSVSLQEFHIIRIWIKTVRLHNNICILFFIIKTTVLPTKGWVLTSRVHVPLETLPYFVISISLWQERIVLVVGSIIILKYVYDNIQISIRKMNEPFWSANQNIHTFAFNYVFVFN